MSKLKEFHPHNLPKIANAVKTVATCLRDPKTFLALSLLSPTVMSIAQSNSPSKIPPQPDRPNQVWIQGEDAKTLLSKANALIDMGNADEAIKQLNRVIELEPTCSEAYRLLGNAKFWKGDLAGALLDLGTAVKLGPNNADAFRDLGIALFKMGNRATALMCFGVAIEIDSSAERYSDRASAHFRLGNYEEAERDYGMAAKLAPDDANVHTNLGQVKHKLGKKNEAMKEFNRAIELDSTWSFAYSGRGKLFSSLGRYNEAIKDFEKALELAPDNLEAIVGLQEAKALRDRQQRGIKRT